MSGNASGGARRPLRVFLSYAAPDEAHARQLQFLLSLRGDVHLFTDEGLNAGEDRGQRLRDQIVRSDVFMLLLSPASVASARVLQELGFAWALGKPIIPVLDHHETSIKIPVELSHRKLVEFHRLDSPEAMTRLLEPYQQAVPREGMRLDALDYLRLRMIADRVPSSEYVLECMMASIQRSLEQSRLLTHVRTKKTADLNGLIEATCRPAAATLTIPEITAEIECLWLEEMRYPHREAHTIRRAHDAASLDFITVSGIGGTYVTGRIAIDVGKTHGPAGTVAFWYRLTGSGCSQAGIHDDVNSVVLTTSHLSDAPRDLANAVIALLAGAETSRCSFAGEPGEHRWLFSRQGDRLRIVLLKFAFDPIPPEPDGRGKQIFSTECDLRQFAGQVTHELRRLLDEHGVEGYKREWRYHFPMAEYRELEALLDQEGSTPA